MEPTSPPPAKRLRITKNVNNLQVTECVREFKLHQQFPSMVTPTRNKITLSRIRNGVTTCNTVHESKKQVSNKDAQVVNSVQKLRIKSQDGRDLGEINVQFLPLKDNMVNGKLITITKPDCLKKVNTLTGISGVSPECISKFVSNLQISQKDAKHMKTLVLPVKFVSAKQVPLSINIQKTEAENKAKIAHKPLILSKTTKSTEKIKEDLDEAKQDVQEKSILAKKTSIVSNIDKEVKNIDIISNGMSKYIKVLPKKEVILRTKKSNGHLVISKKNTLKNSENSVHEGTLNQSIEVKPLDINEPEIVRNKEIHEPEHSLVKYEKLLQSNSNTVEYIKNVDKGLETDRLNIRYENKCNESNFPATTSRSMLTQKNPQNVIVQVTQKNNLKDKILRKKCKNNEDSSNTNSGSKEAIVSTDKNNGAISECRAELNENIMVVQQDKTTTLDKKQTNLKEPDSTLTHSNINIVHKKNQETHKNVNSISISDLNVTIQDIASTVTHSDNSAPCTPQSDSITSTTSNSTNDITNSTVNSNCDAVNDASLKQKLSEQWSIIEKAVSSVKDDELRAKALKALADCGIGLERYIPVHPLEQLKAVNDTQIQTEVFGLLDPENFVLVKEELPTVKRIQQTEKTLPCSSINNSDALMQIRSSQNNLIDNENLFVNRTITCPVIDSCYLDDFFKEYCSENAGANKVNEVLSTPSPFLKQISMQLQRDFKEVKQWDENGMTSIHRAVANDNIHGVQRLLMVMKACKESIDILTEDGMTSLELAIKTNSSPEIVKLLLEAGAQPVSSKLAHDSALIIASKMSSPLLPELLKYVKSRELLDQTDSIGFAALHYCALNGNLDGVNALIKGGANVNLKDNRSGRTPFFHALENDYVLIAQRLIDNGAIANTPNFAGQSVLSLVDDVRNLSLRTTVNKPSS